MTPIQVVTAEGNITPDYAAPGMVDELPSSPTPEQAAEVDGSLAARVEAHAQKLGRRTKRIAVPPDDVWEGQLVVVVRPAKVEGNMPYVKLIADATDHLELLDDRTGRWDRVDGWAELGAIMGVTGVSVGQIIKTVCDRSDEIVNGLGEQVLAFIMGRQSLIEQALGEPSGPTRSSGSW